MGSRKIRSNNYLRLRMQFAIILGKLFIIFLIKLMLQSDVVTYIGKNCSRHRTRIKLYT